MSQGNHAYIDHVRRLEQRLGSGNEAVRLAVGGQFEAVGKLEYYLLRSLGLTTGHLVVDVGCGSRRLAPDKGIRYVGTDVVPRLIESARTSTMPDDWEFSVVEDVLIPCADNAADFITFFSVLTHITHEESFKYLQEAARCLKVGGRVVISFLEFRIPDHWETFIASVKAKAGGPLTQFVDSEEIRWENGTCMKSLGNLGQSVAILRKT
jgi:SAM-dependent methyltransferase